MNMHSNPLWLALWKMAIQAHSSLQIGKFHDAHVVKAHVQ